jgi:glycosyltransferase involved in cell wall biosynthesis
MLLEGIESVLGQDYDNKEILIINYGSIDRSGGIIEKYKKSNTCIKVFKTENQVLSIVLLGSDESNRELLRCIGCGIEVIGFKSCMC